MQAMSEFCLKEGSALIPAASELLRLYSMRFCPYAQRTRLVLVHKNIPHEIINVNLKYKPSWLLSRNPAGLVPVIEYRGGIVCESAICDQFLEESFPHPTLMPDNALERARHRLLMVGFDQDISFLHGMLSDKEEKREKSRARIHSLLERCETLLATNGTKFLTGPQVQMVDFHFWPWFERFPAMSQLRSQPVMPTNEFPCLNKWVKVMDELEAVQKTRLPNDWHAEFLLSLAQRDPKYDIGLEIDSRL